MSATFAFEIAIKLAGIYMLTDLRKEVKLGYEDAGESNQLAMDGSGCENPKSSRVDKL